MIAGWPENLPLLAGGRAGYRENSAKASVPPIARVQIPVLGRGRRRYLRQSACGPPAAQRRIILC